MGIMYISINNCLVVSTPLKNMKVSWDDYSQYMESHKSHVPNHQSDNVDYHILYFNCVYIKYEVFSKVLDSNGFQRTSPKNKS